MRRLDGLACYEGGAGMVAMMGVLSCSRELTASEVSVLDYIKAHPGLKSEEIAANWGHSEAVYYALPYLYLNFYADRDPVTMKITAREI